MTDPQLWTPYLEYSGWRERPKERDAWSDEIEITKLADILELWISLSELTVQPLRVGEVVVLAGEEAEAAPRKEPGVEGLWLCMGGFLRD